MRLLFLAISVLALFFAGQCAEAQTTNELIVKYSTKYGLDANLVRAIMQQESSLRINATNKRSNDYGIGQINIRNVKLRGLNKHRLLTDVHYSIEQSVLMLAELKIKYAAKDPNWWTRYHSFTPSQRLKYQLQVQRHFVPQTIVGAK